MVDWKKWFFALRAWACLCSGIPIVLTAVVVSKFDGATISVLDVVLTILAVGSLHIAANMTNSYVDFKSGCDSKEHAEDRAIVDEIMTPTQVIVTGLGFYAVAFVIGLFYVFRYGWLVLILGFFGFVLSFFYTAGAPYSLKYFCCSEFVNFLACGPFMCMGACTNIAGSIYISSLLFSLPTALLTCASNFANNARDIKQDEKVNANTLARLVGFKNCLTVYIAFIASAYVALALLSALYSWWLLIPLASVFNFLPLIQSFAKGQLDDLPPRTAIRLFTVGLAMILALLLTPGPTRHAVNIPQARA